MSQGDPKHLAPWEGGEEMVSWQSLHERCEGKQISGVYWLIDELPKGWVGVGFVFTNSEVMVCQAVPSMEKEFGARLLIRWIVQQNVWTPSMERKYKYGESRAECQVCPQSYPEPCPGHQTVGELIRGIMAPREPTHTGGDLWIVEFLSGATMLLRAEPHSEFAWAAELDLQVTAKKLHSA